MKRAEPTGRIIALAASAFTAVLCIAMFQMRAAHAAGAVEMQVERIVVQAIGEYNDAMTAGNPAGWLKYFTEGVRRRSPQSEQAGKEAFDDFYRKEFEAFRAKWTTSKMIIAGRSAAVEFEWDAVHKASNTPVKLNMVAIFQLAPNGKFESVNFYFDSAKLAQYNVADASAAK
ncbi:MAG TPA: nuclear transport factor 2 family protein [Burkholderiales bacterium]